MKHLSSSPLKLLKDYSKMVVHCSKLTLWQGHSPVQRLASSVFNFVTFNLIWVDTPLSSAAISMVNNWPLTNWLFMGWPSYCRSLSVFFFLVAPFEGITITLLCSIFISLLEKKNICLENKFILLVFVLQTV